MSYGWMITRDFLFEENSASDVWGSEVGAVGPSAITKHHDWELSRGEGQTFRMYDDDDILYYEGRIVSTDMDCDLYGPLEDFGLPNAGCTTIKYKEEVKECDCGWKAV